MKYAILVLLLSIVPLWSLWANETEYKIDELLDPVVMIKLPVSSGSGVVAYSESVDDGYRTFILTNYHVVDRAVHFNKKTGVEIRDLVTVRTFMYEDGGSELTMCDTKAYIACYNKTLDVALLELADRSIKLSTVQFLPKDKKMHLFQEIWNVGCPDGDPLNFAQGIITQFGKDMYFGEFGTKAEYIRTNSPIYFGNSGGGTFLYSDGTYFLIGMPTRIKENKAPYVNYSVDIGTIRKFFKEKKLDFIEDKTLPIPKYVRPMPTITPDPFEGIFEFIIPFKRTGTKQ